MLSSGTNILNSVISEFRKTSFPNLGGMSAQQQVVIQDGIPTGRIILLFAKALSPIESTVSGIPNPYILRHSMAHGAIIFKSSSGHPIISSTKLLYSILPSNEYMEHSYSLRNRLSSDIDIFEYR